MSAACPVFVFSVSLRGAPDQIPDLLTKLERNGLLAERRGPLEFVIRREGGQATHADREIVLEWARQHADVEAAVSDIIELET